MNPAFAYYGGKVGMSRQIVAMLPPHRVYIEPFAGSLAVLFAKPPAQHEIVNDLDRAIVTFYRVLREQPLELARVCRLTPHARSEFDAADCDAAGLSDLEVARRWFCRVGQSFAKTGNTRTGWSVTTARTQSVPATILGRIKRFEALAARLQHVSIECCDAADLISRLATPDAVVYLDPPYVGSSRMSATKRSGIDYRCELDDVGHRRLAEAARATSARVLVSGYPSQLYDELFGDWCKVDVNVTAYSSNRSKASRSLRTERLWANYDIGARQPELALGGAA
jgi:DNA adenine methylase